MFSIIIPTYNSSVRLKNAIKSVLLQTWQDFEIIIVDDGSVDDTKEVVEAIGDQRIVYLYKDNGGPASARNLGLKRAERNYICLLDADDEYDENKLFLTAGIIKDHNSPDIIFTDALYIDQFNNKTYKFYNSIKFDPAKIISLSKSLLKGNFFVNSTVCFNRQTFLNKELQFDESNDLKFVEDYDLWLRASALSLSHYFMDIPLTNYYIHGENGSSNRLRTYKSLIKVYQKNRSQDKLFNMHKVLSLKLKICLFKILRK